MNAFRTYADSDARPTLLVRSDGAVIDYNRAAARAIGGLSAGVELAGLVQDPHADVRQYLSVCAATRGPVVGTLSLRDPTGEAKRWQSHGGLATAADATRAAEVVIRLRDRFEAHQGFMALTDRIGQLHRELHERKRLQHSLEIALAAKDMLLAELNHRVKNNLQVVTGMLGLAMRRDGTSPALRQAVERVGAVAKVHELLYVDGEGGDVDCRSLLATLASGISDIQGRPGITITTASADLRLDADRATSLALIVNELVANAFKHGFPDQRPGSIRVVLDVTDRGVATLSVADDGACWSDISSRTSGSGLRIVESLTTRLGGSLQLPRTDAKAVVVTFEVRRGRSSG